MDSPGTLRCCPRDIGSGRWSYAPEGGSYLAEEHLGAQCWLTRVARKSSTSVVAGVPLDPQSALVRTPTDVRCPTRTTKKPSFCNEFTSCIQLSPKNVIHNDRQIPVINIYLSVTCFYLWQFHELTNDRQWIMNQEGYNNTRFEVPFQYLSRLKNQPRNSPSFMNPKDHYFVQYRPTLCSNSNLITPVHTLLI